MFLSHPSTVNGDIILWGTVSIFFFPVSEQTVKAMTYLSKSKQQTFFIHQNITICSRETDLFKYLPKANCSSFHSLTSPLQQAPRCDLCSFISYFMAKYKKTESDIFAILNHKERKISINSLWTIRLWNNKLHISTRFTAVKYCQQCSLHVHQHFMHSLSQSQSHLINYGFCWLCGAHVVKDLRKVKIVHTYLQ